MINMEVELSTLLEFAEDYCECETGILCVACSFINGWETMSLKNYHRCRDYLSSKYLEHHNKQIASEWYPFKPFFKEDDARNKWDLNITSKDPKIATAIKCLEKQSELDVERAIIKEDKEFLEKLDPNTSKEGKKKLCSEALHPELCHPLVDVAELSIEKGYEPFNYLEEGKASTHLLYWFNAAQRHFDKAKMGFDINDEEKTLDGEPTKTKPYHLAQAAYCLLTALYLQKQEVCIDDRRFKDGKIKKTLS